MNYHIQKKHLLFMTIMLFIASGAVFAQSNPGHPWSQIDCAGCITSSNILDLTISSSDIASSAVTDAKISSMQWTKLYNYPAACSSGQFISALGDTITCGTPGGGGGWTDDGTVVRLTTSSDNVGIGTSSPGSKLDVNGWAQFVSPGSGSTGGVRIAAPSSGNPAYLQFTNNAKNAEWANIAATSSGHLLLNPQGGVGIGTSSPTSALHVGPSRSVRFDLGSGYKVSLGGAGSFGIDAPGIVDGRFVVTNAGSVGIGTNSPGYKLEVIGTGRFSDRLTTATQTWGGDITWNNGVNILANGENSIDVGSGGTWGVWDGVNNRYFLSTSPSGPVTIGAGGLRVDKGDNSIVIVAGSSSYAEIYYSASTNWEVGTGYSGSTGGANSFYWFNGAQKMALTTGGTLYASAFYDQDNSNYYVNPNSASRLAGDLYVGGFIYGKPFCYMVIVDCQGECSDEDTLDNICINRFGSSYYALTVACDSVQPSGTADCGAGDGTCGTHTIGNSGLGSFCANTDSGDAIVTCCYKP